MPSRQDQLHSYQYSQQRVVAALVTHDPDPHRSPLRRAGTTALVSLVIAALALCGAAVYGLLTNASTVNLADENVVYLEKDTGARYVYLKSDQKLHPVLNFSSGLLIATGQERKMVSTTRKRLATVALGDPLGIPEAPDSLPTAKELTRAPWSICTAQPDSRSGAAEARSTLLVGDPPAGGSVAVAPTADRIGQAVLVADHTERTFLVYGGRRFEIPADNVSGTVRAMDWGGRQPFPVSAAWLNALPVGPQLRAPRIPDRGDPGYGDFRIGQLLTNGSRHLVVLADGTADVTDVQARLMQAERGAFEVRRVGAEFNTLPPSRTGLTGDEGLPTSVPELTSPSRALCMTLPIDNAGDAVLRVDPTVPAGIPATEGAAAPGAVQADAVHVRRGSGALVAAVASPTAPAGTGTVSVVTDTGRRYPLAGRELMVKLGFTEADVRQVPAQLVNLAPPGPALDPAEARKPR